MSQELQIPTIQSSDKSTAFSDLTTVEKHFVLAPHIASAWPLDRLMRLCQEWEAGTHTKHIGDGLGCGKNAVCGKTYRLCNGGVLVPRGNPGGRRGGAAGLARVVASTSVPRPPRRAPAVTLAVTLAALPSLTTAEPAPPPPIPKRVTPAALNRPLKAAPKPRPAHASPDVAELPHIPRYTPPAERHGRVVECSWPIGEPRSPGFHYCDEPSERGCSYCEEHNRLGHIRARGHAAPLAGTGAVLSGSAPP